MPGFILQSSGRPIPPTTATKSGRVSRPSAKRKATEQSTKKKGTEPATKKKVFWSSSKEEGWIVRSEMEAGQYFVDDSCLLCSYIHLQASSADDTCLL